MTEELSGNPSAGERSQFESFRSYESPKPIAVLSDAAFVLPPLVRTFVAAGLPLKIWCAQPGWRVAMQKATEEASATFTPGPAPEIELMDETADWRSCFSGATGAVVLSPVEPQGRASQAEDHLAWVKSVAHAAEEARLTRLVYLSSVNADRKSPATCFREAGEAEGLVAERAESVFVLRSTPLWSKDAPWVKKFLRRANSPFPLMGVPSYGDPYVQPLHVEDFALILCRLFLPSGADLSSGTFVLTGPETTTLLEIQDLLFHRCRRWKLKLHLPGFLIWMTAMALKPLGVRLSRRLRDVSVLMNAVFAADKNDMARLLEPSRQPFKLERMLDELIAHPVETPPVVRASVAP